ncbi:MAG: potassium transporter TrkG, partial [Bdellovibrionota bacterium]|nr:potassium transporter TrkG [Bdellovibrionota bacterium]
FGASPSGTGGGLKTTTFTAMFGLIKSILKGRDSIRFKKREIPDAKLYSALAAFSYYIFVLFIFTFLICSLHPDIEFKRIIFEIASALGTVGISMGITSDLVNSSKILFVILMLMGRVGILTFGIAITSKDESIKEEKDNDLVI